MKYLNVDGCLTKIYYLLSNSAGKDTPLDVTTHVKSVLDYQCIRLVS